MKLKYYEQVDGSVAADDIHGPSLQDSLRANGSDETGNHNVDITSSGDKGIDHIDLQGLVCDSQNISSSLNQQELGRDVTSVGNLTQSDENNPCAQDTMISIVESHESGLIGREISSVAQSQQNKNKSRKRKR